MSPALAVLAGLVSFVSPCVLPLVPAYLAYLGARAAQPAPPGIAPAVLGPRDGTPREGAAPATSSISLPVAAAGAGFVAGLSLVFILFFYLFSLVVQPIRAYVPVVAGVFVIALALHV
ncbi:MAG TPA: cytochrome c biogenesis protein CcdA, partial [Candidatus Sulfotelmatobacter sp.]|nr:cytochrome c biogenesis protein CcdA [Candidatus Sulfotelmatobacter sp.]